MRRTTLGIVAALTLMTTVATHAACIDDITFLTTELETLQGKATEELPSSDTATAANPETEASASATAGEALTGDPLNPKPSSPGVEEEPTVIPEGESVMPGADASVDLVGEELAEVSALLDQARSASESGDESACVESIGSARDLMSRLSAAN